MKREMSVCIEAEEDRRRLCWVMTDDPFELAPILYAPITQYNVTP